MQRNLGIVQVALSCFISWMFPRYSAWFQFFPYMSNDCPFRLLPAIFLEKSILVEKAFNRVVNQDNFFRSFDASLIMSIEESRILIFNVLNTSHAYNFFFLWHVYISRKTCSFWLALLLWTLRWLLCAINFYRILNYFTKVFTLSVLILKNKKTFHINVPTLTQKQKFCSMQFAR